MKKRLLIGVLITECHVEFQEELLRGIIDQAFKSNTDIAVLTTMHNFFIDSPHHDTDKLICDLILSDKFSGFLYDRNTFYDESMKKRIDELLVMSGKPVMLLDAQEHKSFETSSADDCGAFETITDHLIEQHGLKKIYCLTGPKGAFLAEERLKGYKNAMKKHKLTINRSYYEYGDFWLDAPKKFAGRIINGELEMPEAVVCGNDLMAVQLSKTLIGAGIKVPDDVAITGYDNSDEARRAVPSITSYSRPNYQLGAESFRRLYRIITGRICKKVPNENGTIRLGRSCGCTENDHVKSSIIRRDRINKNFERNMLYGDMLFDITNAGSIAAFADKIDNYTYLIYKLSKIKLCLTKKYIDSVSGIYNDKLDFRCGDEVKVILSKTSVKREYEECGYFTSDEILPDFSRQKNYPTAYYLVPLHYNDNFFGYSAVSFGKNPFVYSSLYLQWINYTNIALEQVRIKSMMNGTIMNTNRAILYDKTTGILNRAGIEQEFSRRTDLSGRSEAIDYITIELTGLNRIYYRSGEDRCSQITAAFADAMKQCIKENEIFGMWNSQTFCIISPERDRLKKIYGYICTKIKEQLFEAGGCLNVEFSAGVYTAGPDEKTDLSEAVHKSMVSRNYVYTVSDNNANPQFEKFCALRTRIKNAPAKPWNISDIAEELFLSKSYLQKMYKTFFNKSIIEEMIEFRVEAAKKLLGETNDTVTDISKKCGYTSYNYFVRQFKMIVGISPSEYREELIRHPKMEV